MPNIDELIPLPVRNPVRKERERNEVLDALMNDIYGGKFAPQQPVVAEGSNEIGELLRKVNERKAPDGRPSLTNYDPTIADKVGKVLSDIFGYGTGRRVVGTEGVGGMKVEPGTLPGNVKEIIAKAAAGGASALDPLSIPSAAVGTMSPEARDSWRRFQQSEGVVPYMAGQVVGGGGAFGMGMKGATKLADKMVRAGGMSAASDLIDAAAGKEGALSADTAFKAGVGGAMMLPAKPLLYAAGGLGATAGGSYAFDQMNKPTSALENITRMRSDLSSAQAERDKLFNKSQDYVAESPQGLSRSQIRAIQRKVGVKDDGRWGNGTYSAVVRWNEAAQKAKEQLPEFDARIKGLRGTIAALQIKADDEERRNLEANTPLKQLYPNETLMGQGALALGGLGVTALLQRLGLKGKNADILKHNRDLSRAEAQVNKAIDAGDLIKKAAAQKRAADLNANASRVAGGGVTGMVKDAGRMVPAVAGFEAASIAPDVVDYYRSGTGSPLHDKAKSELDWKKILERTAVSVPAGIVTGKLTGGMMKAFTPQRQVKNVDSQMAGWKALDDMTPSKMAAEAKRFQEIRDISLNNQRTLGKQRQIAEKDRLVAEKDRLVDSEAQRTFREVLRRSSQRKDQALEQEVQREVGRRALQGLGLPTNPQPGSAISSNQPSNRPPRSKDTTLAGKPQREISGGLGYAMRKMGYKPLDKKQGETRGEFNRREREHRHAWMRENGFLKGSEKPKRPKQSPRKALPAKRPTPHRGPDGRFARRSNGDKLPSLALPGASAGLAAFLASRQQQ